MPSTGFKLKKNTLTPGIKFFDDALDERLQILTDYHAQRAEDEMKQNAPWEDQTSNARNGLRGKAFHEAKKSHSIVLAHSVPYGIWLEIRHEGRYAIILPTLKSTSRELMGSLNKLFKTVRKH